MIALVSLQLPPATLDVDNLLLEHMLILTLGDTIAEVHDVLRHAALTHRRHPLAEQRRQHILHVGLRNDLDTMPVRLASSSIPAAKGVHGYSECRHRGLQTPRSRMRDISSNNHGRAFEMTHPLVRRRTWDPRSGPSKLGIELHQDVGDILALNPSDMCGLHALGDDAKAAIARFLDTHVVV